MMLTILTYVLTKLGNQFQVELPAKRIVCPTCNGNGSHVNPAVDGHGISPDEFAEDPEFAESYFQGVYDVACEECHGKRVVDVVAVDELTPKMRERYERQQDAEAADRREIAAERRMCGGGY
jgi:RecJ-like exonuclease